MQTLANIADYVSEKISSRDITLEQYVTTDSLLQDKRGRQCAQNLPPVSCNLTHFKKGDVLVANIRPYLKKIWYAVTEGGCSSDVLAFRAKESSCSDFLYAILMADSFYSHAMVGAKGSKMPRGDKDQIMRYKLPILSNVKNIGKMIVDIDSKISLNRSINHNLEVMAKQLYDYWFVQFDFPNEDGKPYKSSGGKMVWNEKLKRKIPKGWECKRLSEVVDIINGATPSTANEENYGDDVIWITPKDLSNQQSKFVDQGQRNITQKGFNSCSTSLLPVGTLLLSSRAPIGLLSIAKTKLCTNQGFKSLVPKKTNDTNFLYYYIQRHVPQIEQLGSGTTFKEVSKDDLSSFPVFSITNEVVYSKWCETSDSLFNQQYELTKEITELTKQRDELLLLLMNGQVTVNYDLSHC